MSDTSQSLDQIEVVVVDDEIDIRLLLKLQFRSAGIDVVGEAQTGREALDVCIALAPHVVVMDLLMPEMNGFEAIPLLQERCPTTKIVAYSAVAGEFARTEMERLGVPLRLKNGDPDPLVEVIRALAAERAAG